MNLHYLQFALVLSGALAVTATAKADDKLIVTGTDSKKAEISLSGISQITFDGDRMTVETATGNFDYQLASVDNLSFDLEASAVDNIEVSLRKDVSLSISGGILSVCAPSGQPLSVAVYNLKGVLVARQSGMENVSIDFNPMAQGVYIVKANGKTIKFIR